jgi:large subunit ribosomal protein L4
MVKVDSYSKTGAKTAQLNLDKEIFETQINKSLIKQAYLRDNSNTRTNNAQTLTRGKVSGGGKKPWRQKGTGRARSGSIRNPIWRGGGITFGPTGEENYTKKMPQKMRKIALKSALSDKAKDIKVVESVKISEYKTQKAINLLAKLDAQGRILIISDKSDAKTIKSFANIADLNIVSYDQISVSNVMNADSVIIEKPVLAKIKDWLVK